MARRPERQILLMALVVFAMTGLAVRSAGAPTVVDRALGRITTPVQRLLTGATGGVHDIVGGLRDLDNLRRRNAALEEQASALEVENTKVKDLEREVGQLRDELNFKRQRVDLSLTGASVVGHEIAGEPGSLLHTIKIDVGSRDGVGKGMPVASSRGLVGEVAATGPYWSDVRLITDPASGVWGRIQRSRATGVVFGSTTGELRMRFLPQNTPDEPPNVAEGDLVYTSGLSPQYPPLILIGQVVSVLQSDEKTHQEAVVRPSVSFNALEVVLVVNHWLPAPGAEVTGADATSGP
jgi:rod shape-determining protein MreC